jgi:hypothetical protein
MTRRLPLHLIMSASGRKPLPAKDRTVGISAAVLPAHREWLISRPEGTSAVIRQLVEAAMQADREYVAEPPRAPTGARPSAGFCPHCGNIMTVTRPGYFGCRHDRCQSQWETEGELPPEAIQALSAFD